MQCTVATRAVLLAWWASDRDFWRRASSLGVLAAALPAACIPLLSRSSKLVTKSMGDHFLPEGLAGAWDKLAFQGDGLRVQWARNWAGVIVAPRDSGSNLCRNLRYCHGLAEIPASE